VDEKRRMISDRFSRFLKLVSFLRWSGPDGWGSPQPILGVPDLDSCFVSDSSLNLNKTR
jgi:hypothetical protein